MFFGSGWLDLEDIKLICEQIFSFFFLLRCNFVALVLASIATCKRVAVHGSKKAKAKNYILLHFHALFLPCTLSSSNFFFFAYFSLAHYFSANDSRLSSFFRFGICLDCVFYPMCLRLVEIWWVLCTVHKTCKYISHKKQLQKWVP